MLPGRTGPRLPRTFAIFVVPRSARGHNTVLGISLPSSPVSRLLSHRSLLQCIRARCAPAVMSICSRGSKLASDQHIPCTQHCCLRPAALPIAAVLMLRSARRNDLTWSTSSSCKQVDESRSQRMAGAEAPARAYLSARTDRSRTSEYGGPYRPKPTRCRAVQDRAALPKQHLDVSNRPATLQSRRISTSPTAQRPQADGTSSLKRRSASDTTSPVACCRSSRHMLSGRSQRTTPAPTAMPLSEDCSAACQEPCLRHHPRVVPPATERRSVRAAGPC